MIHLSVTTLVPVHLWSVSLKKNTIFETEINEILISHLNRFHST